MAYRELGMMVEVREVLRRWLAGEGVRAIARGVGLDRKTIAAYVQAAVAGGIQRGGAPPTDEQLTAIATARRPGRPTNASAPSPEVERLRPQEAMMVRRRRRAGIGCRCALNGVCRLELGEALDEHRIRAEVNNRDEMCAVPARQSARREVL